jgi:hypothetical protein
MAEVLVDDLIVRFLADVPAGDKTDAVGLLRIFAAALRSPQDMAAALERAAARLEGAAGA